MYFKMKYRAARPFQYYPALMPPFLTPPHASYPNAHALQSNLTALILKSVCPRALDDAIDALAYRIGYNRELAGVHFRQDREASEKIAKAVFCLLDESASYVELRKRADEEWR